MGCAPIAQFIPARGWRRTAAGLVHGPVAPTLTYDFRLSRRRSGSALTRDASGIHKRTLEDFEGGNSVPRVRTLTAIRTALEAADVEFIVENGGGAEVRLTQGE